MASSPRRRRSSYDLGPRWLSTGKVIAAVLLAAVGAGLIYGTRVAIALGHLGGTNPASAVIQLFQKGSSSVEASTRSMQRINIAMYGYGGNGHDGAYLTDSIMVVSIQPQRDGPPQIAEVSVPRDWYVPIDIGNGRVDHERINAAYALGMAGTTDVPAGPKAGGTVANRTLEKVLGIHIDHWVGVDFTAFQSGVDAVGGIDVNVAHTFTDTQYPRGECGEPGGDCGLMTVHFNAGMQHMDGRTALIFSRSRHSLDPAEGTDFARSHRQQLVVAALKQKVVSIGGIGNLPDLLNALGDHIVTDMQVNDGAALYDLVKGVDPASIEHVSIDDTNFLYECGYPARCPAAYIYAHDQTFVSLGHFMQSLVTPLAVLAEHVPVTVVDASGRLAGPANRWAAIFAQTGLTTHSGGVQRTRMATTVIDNSNGTGGQTAAWLASYFGTTVQPAATPTVTPATRVAGAPTALHPVAAGVTVILGADEERAFNASGS